MMHDTQIEAQESAPLAYTDGIVVGQYRAPLGDNVEQVEFNNSAAFPFKVNSKGLYYREEKEDDDGGLAVEWRWICGPLHILAETHDSESQNWGKLVALTDRAGVRHEWPIPMEMLSGTGEEVRKQLLSFGLNIAPSGTARTRLNEYLVSAQPKARYRCVDRVGWYGRKFVLPDETFGDDENERVIYQTVGKVEHSYRQSGTLNDWIESVAAPAMGNSRLQFALSVAFAGPLIGLLREEGGGFHIRGSSSTGKSTALIVAGSVWGGGEPGGYIRQWRATDNALESVALRHNDVLLCLDEIGQVSGKTAGEVAYMLANGAGKARANKSGNARNVANWRVLFLSSGEISVADKMAEDIRGPKTRAGQEVRVVDIPADAGGRYRLFEDIHEHEDGDSFARFLKKACGEHYGVAGRKYLGEVVRYRDVVLESIKQYRENFMREAAPDNADGQVLRVLSRFAIVASAGELATELGILPWREGDAIRAARSCFEAWLNVRGGTEAAEVQQAVSQVRLFIEKHGASRFEPWSGSDTPVRDRVGYRRRCEETNIEDYFFLKEGFNNEVCKGLDSSIVTKALRSKGLLITKDGNRSQTAHKPPAHGATVKLYHVSGHILSGGEHE